MFSAMCQKHIYETISPSYCGWKSIWFDILQFICICTVSLLHLLHIADSNLHACEQKGHPSLSTLFQCCPASLIVEFWSPRSCKEVKVYIEVWSIDSIEPDTVIVACCCPWLVISTWNDHGVGLRAATPKRNERVSPEKRGVHSLWSQLRTWNLQITPVQSKGPRIAAQWHRVPSFVLKLVNLRHLL